MSDPVENINCFNSLSRVTHICVSKLTIIGSENGLSPDRRQAIIWTNDGLLLIGPLGTNFSEILIEILPFSFKKMRLKMSSGKWRPFCLGLNVLTHWGLVVPNGVRELNNIQVMATGDKLVPEPMQTYFQLTLKNKLQRYLDQNTMTFIKWNAHENVICKMSAILFWLKCTGIGLDCTANVLKWIMESSV